MCRCWLNVQMYIPVVLTTPFASQVFLSRSLLNPKRRQKLGILTIAATSLQIHALRARGSVDAYTGEWVDDV